MRSACSGKQVLARLGAKTFVMPNLESLKARARECRMLAVTSLTDEGRMVLEELAIAFEDRASRESVIGKSSKDDRWYWPQKMTEAAQFKGKHQ